MRADNTHHLIHAAQQRHTDTARRAAAAIRQLDAAGQPVTFSAVADAANVSRSWLYRDHDTRAEIHRLRQATPANESHPQPSAHRGSADSWRERYETLLQANRELTNENQKLRQQITALLGERRATRTGSHTPD